MKKIFLVGALALFSGMNAQVKYGVKAGYNLSNISAKSTASSVRFLLGNKSGFNVGGFVEYGLGNNLSLQGEVLYSNVGAKLTVDTDKLNEEQLRNLPEIGELDFKKANATLSLSQISVPVSLKYTFDKFSVLGGCTINFKAGAKTKLELDGKSVDTNEDVDIDETIKSQLSSANFGLHLGGEYMFNDNVFVDARYNFGASSLNKNFTDYVNLKQRYFQMSIGYKF